MFPAASTALTYRYHIPSTPDNLTNPLSGTSFQPSSSSGGDSSLDHHIYFPSVGNASLNVIWVETLSTSLTLPLGLISISGATESIVYDLVATSVFPDESDAST